MDIARKDEFARMWLREITEVIAALEDMSVEELRRKEAEQIRHLEQLSADIRERLADLARTN